ncbi:hypothetical protein [Allosalinactinospora lopnorensis]|nr:hypothetical protein [Allosalinactinospora lopnorensis]
MIDRLQKAGYAHSEECGRAIIQERTTIGGHTLPWVTPTWSPR